MVRWFSGLLVAVALVMFSAYACGSEGQSFDNPPPPQYRLGAEATAIVPDARGMAELVLPAGETILAFLPATSRSGNYGFSLRGTSTTSGVSVESGAVAEVTKATTASAANFAPAAADFEPMNTVAPETRTFTAPAGRHKEGFVSVDAVKVAEGARVVFYAEESNSMVHEMAQNIVDYFDSVVYPESTLLFGPIPDVDRNGKVVLLATTAVNNYSSVPGQFTGGFFASKDLNSREGSNNADMLYLYMPKTIEEGGVYDHPEEYERLSKEVIVHELQHMINYGERLSRGARLESTWLNEGLSHYAEAHFGFHRSNTIRSGHFLKSPETTPLVGKCATLAERGAAFMFVKYLVETSDDPMLLQKLVRTGRRGIDNLENATGKPFESVLRDWAAYLYEDNAKTVKVDAVDGYEFDAELPQSAPKFIRVQGPGVLTLRTEPRGAFQGMGFVVPTEVASADE